MYQYQEGDFRGVLVGYTIIPRLNRGEHLLVLLNQLAKLIHEIPPLRRTHLPPRPLERRPRRRDRTVYILWLRSMHRGDLTLIRRVDARDLVALAAGNPLVVDEETSGLRVLFAIGSCELDREIRGGCHAAESSEGSEA